MVYTCTKQPCLSFLFLMTSHPLARFFGPGSSMATSNVVLLVFVLGVVVVIRFSKY